MVELGLVEQRYRAVLEVLNDGATVTDVAARYGVVRQTVHTVTLPVHVEVAECEHVLLPDRSSRNHTRHHFAIAGSSRVRSPP